MQLTTRCTLRAVIAVTLGVLFPPVATADSIALTGVGVPYTQDFNTLATSTSSLHDISTLPPGWTFTEFGSNGNLTYAADGGTATVGNTYSLGTAGSTDRALSDDVV